MCHMAERLETWVKKGHHTTWNFPLECCREYRIFSSFRQDITSVNHCACVGGMGSLHLRRIGRRARREANARVRRFPADNLTSPSTTPKGAMRGCGSNYTPKTCDGVEVYKTSVQNLFKLGHNQYM